MENTDQNPPKPAPTKRRVYLKHNRSYTPYIQQDRKKHKTRGRTLPTLTADQKERFWKHVDVRGSEQCWLWKGATSLSSDTNDKRYGLWRLTERPVVAVRPHRVAFTLLVGPIPEGYTIDHVLAKGCTSTLCCNPAHLEAVTIGENVRRYYRAMTKCKRGHDRTPMSGPCLICKAGGDKAGRIRRQQQSTEAIRLVETFEQPVAPLPSPTPEAVCP